MASAAKPRSRKLCFDPQLLESDDFDVQKFVASIRTKVSLSILRDDLHANLEHLQAELVASVQHDFQAFVSLGPSISEVEPLAKNALQPMGYLREDLSTLVNSLDAEISQLSTALERRATISKRKIALETILRSNDLLAKSERLLKSYAQMKMDNEALRLAERIATTFAQLEYALSGAGEGKFVASLRVRIGIVKRDVRKMLDGWMKRALFPSSNTTVDRYDTDILSRALGMYVSAGLALEAEAFFKKEVVEPFANSRLKLAPMLASAERRTEKGTSVTAADALECAVEETLGFIGEKVTPLVSLVDSEEKFRTRLDFVGHSVWPAIESAVVSNMSAAFSPGIPDVFHRSVCAGAKLYEAMEAATGSETARKALRGSEATTIFWRRWNLPVYFQLRFLDITTAFDNALGEGPVNVPKETAATRGTTPGLLRADVYCVKATAALLAGLRRCWAEDVFLSALAHRFVRLSLQLLARYVTWVRSGLAGEWKDESSVLDGAAFVHADVVLLQRRVPAELAAVQRKRNAGLDENLLEDLDCAFSEAVGVFAALLPDLQRTMADSLAKKCTDNLKPLRSILLTYPMSTKKASTTHSQFVPKILKPLESFVEKHEKNVGKDERASIAKDVVEQTANAYCDMATELLSKKKTREETLRRLNIGRGGGAVPTNNVTGVKDKIATQLCLDVDQFIVEIAKYGVNVDDVPSAKRLADCVKGEDEPDNNATEGKTAETEKEPDNNDEN